MIFYYNHFVFKNYKKIEIKDVKITESRLATIEAAVVTLQNKEIRINYRINYILKHKCTL